MQDAILSKGLKADKGKRTDKQASNESDGEEKVLAAIAAMPKPDRDIAERLHAIIKASAPSLSPKLWYTMPAYVKEGRVICFFRESHTRPATGRAPSVGAMRYVTFGFNEWATPDGATGCGPPCASICLALLSRG